MSSNAVKASMSSTLRPGPRPAVASQELSAEPFETADRTRDNLDARCAAAAEQYSDALDAEARALTLAGAKTLGTWTQFRGLHTPAIWREVRRGLRHLHAFDLFRMATSHHPVSRAFVVEYVRELAAGLGYDLAPRKSPAVSLMEAAARLQKETAEVTTSTMRALDDGSVDLEEINGILSEASDVAQALPAVIAAAEAARDDLLARGGRR